MTSGETEEKRGSGKEGSGGEMWEAGEEQVGVSTAMAHLSRTFLVVGSSVAKSLSSASTPACRESRERGHKEEKRSGGEGHTWAAGWGMEL